MTSAGLQPSAGDETGQQIAPSDPASGREGAKEPAGLRYDAFISYSRRDLDVADKIERDLESFPLPHDIRKRLGRRHLNVFRDISDMTGNRLEPALEQHLEQSRTLVVLCSPAACRSAYVSMEINRFAQLRNAENIVPALVAGGPNNDPTVDGADWAFPDALEDALGGDPLAADLRQNWSAKGRKAKLARGSPWVQLVAGIVGATTDDLTARIAKAERRRLQSAVVLLAVVLVVVGSLGVVAWKQRDQAKLAAERVLQVQQISRLTSDIGSKPQRNLLLSVQAADLAREGHDETLLAIDGIRGQLQVASGLPLLGHPEATRAGSFSTDRRWLATGSDDGTIKLWHLDAIDPTGSSSSLAGHEGAIKGLAFTPDGRWLVSGGVDGTVRLWRLTDDGATPGPVLGSGRYGAVNALAISPDGAWLAFGTKAGNTCIWKRSADGFIEAPCEVGKDSNPVTTVRFSAKGRWLATTCTSACATKGAAVALWDLKAGFPNQEPRRLTHANFLNEDSLLAVAFSRDESRLAVAYGYAAEVWDLTQPDPPQHVVATAGRGQWIGAVALSPDNRWLATGSLEADVMLTDLEQPTAPPVFLKGHSAGVGALTFSDDGHWLASGSDDSTARLWNMRDRTFPSTLLRGQELPVRAVTFTPGADPRNLLATGYAPNARLWTVPDPLIDPVVLRSDGPPSALSGMAVSPDGKWIATSNDGNHDLALWSTEDYRRPAAKLPVPSASHSIAFSPDGRWLAAKSEADGVISLWDIRNLGRPPHEFSEDSRSDNESLSFSPDSRWMVSGTWSGAVTMWDVSDNNPATTPRHHCQQGAGVRLRPAFSPDGHYVATAANEWEAGARLWDLTSPDPCADPRVLDPHKKNDNPNPDTAYEVQFSPDNHWAATTSMDRVGRLWDLHSGAEPKLLAQAEFGDRVVETAFSPDNHWVAFGSWDGTAKLLDLTNADSAKPLAVPGHPGRMLSLAFTPDGRWLVTGGEDRTVRLWDPTDLSAAPVILRGHEAGVFQIGFTQDGRRMVTGALDGTVRVWRLKLADLIDVACRIAGRELTTDEVTAFLGGAQAQHLCGGTGYR